MKNPLRHLSLRTKATLGAVGTIALAMALTAAVTIHQVNRYLATAEREDTETAAANLAQACELALAVRDQIELTRLAQGAARDPNVVFAVIYDKHGQMVAQVAADPEAWEEYRQGKCERGADCFLATADVLLTSPQDFGDFADAARGGSAAATKPAPPRGPGTLGRVVLAHSTAPLRATQRVLATTIVGVTVLAAGASALLVFVTVAVWTRRLQHLVHASERISQGDYTGAIDTTGTDEIGRLARAYDDMRAALHHRDRELRALNESLQERVEQRTAALVRAKADAEAAAASLQESEARMRAIVEYAADGVVTLDEDGRIQLFNPAAQAVFGYPAAEVLGRAFAELLDAAERGADGPLAACLRAGAVGAVNRELRGQRRDGTAFPMHLALSAVRQGERRLFTAIIQDITARKQAEREREEMNRRLVEASRQAGMAEVATGVLHNVGNVLNSVNVSATLVSERLRQTKAAGLAKAAALLQEHAHDLAGFLASDQRGQQLPAYLAKLAEHLAQEQAGLLQELASLTQNVEHIKGIVAMQQSYAKVSGVTEPVDLAELLEDAVRMNLAALDRHRVTLVRQYQPTPPVVADKHKVLQIMVNLLSNAKYALAEGGRPDKHLTLRVHPSPADPGRVTIQVRDDGVGIAAENLTRVFSHGFTTRRGGHGFGLHTSALAAKDMGGSLVAHSDGPGAGATFTLELPVTAPSGSQAAPPAVH